MLVKNLPIDPACGRGMILVEKPYHKKGWDADKKEQTDTFVGYAFQVVCPKAKFAPATILVTGVKIDVEAFAVDEPVEFEGLAMSAKSNFNNPKEAELIGTATGVKQAGTVKAQA